MSDSGVDELPIGTIVFICDICQDINVSRENIMTHMQAQHGLDYSAALRGISSYMTAVLDQSSVTEPEFVDDNSILLEQNPIAEEESDGDVGIDSKMWTTETTNYLINLYKEHEEDFEKKVKKHVWQKIAKALNLKSNKGFTGAHCDTKWKGLLRTYKEHKTHQSTSGKGRRKWEFYEEMNSVLFNKPEINAVATCSNHSGLVLKKGPTDPVEALNTNDEAKNEAPTNSKPIGTYKTSFTRQRRCAESLVEKRHQEKLKRLDKYLDCMERLVNAVEIKKRKRYDPTTDSNSD